MVHSVATIRAIVLPPLDVFKLNYYFTYEYGNDRSHLLFIAAVNCNSARYSEG